MFRSRSPHALLPFLVWLAISGNIALLSCIISSTASSDDWSMEVTVDNQYDIYFGSSTIVPTYVGGDLNWPASETWAINNISSTAYLYVSTASDWGVAQGFLGSFTNLTTGTVINTTTDPNLFLTFPSNPWEVFPAGQHLADLNAIDPTIPASTWFANILPTQAQVEVAVAYASANSLWVPVSSAPNYRNMDLPSPWNFLFTSIPGQAEWIWHETGLSSPAGNVPSPFYGFNHHEFLVFRVPGRQPVERNHHKVYQVYDYPFARRVELLDQFRSTPLDIVLGPLDLFANPVDKNGEGIERPKEHQNWYRLPPSKPPVNRFVSLNNQFGDQELSTWDEAYLVVPSEKNNEGAPGGCTAPPSMMGQDCLKHLDCDATPGDALGRCGELRHFLCYDVLPGASFTQTTVSLVDQWGSQGVDLLEPRYFCNPVQKTLFGCCDADLNNDGFVNKSDETILANCGGNLSLCDVNCDGVIDAIDTQILECQHLAGGQNPACCPSSEGSNVYPIVDSSAHMTCYDTTPKVDAGVDVQTADQFRAVSPAVKENDLLCVPSIKYGFAIILDTDDDEINDDVDAFPLNPNEQFDTDGDGIGNNADLDDDGDSLLDTVESGTGTFVNAQDTGTDPLNADTDGDSVGDGVEVNLGTNPLDAADFPALPMMSPLGNQLLILAMMCIAAFFSLRPRSKSALGNGW